MSRRIGSTLAIRQALLLATLFFLISCATQPEQQSFQDLLDNLREGYALPGLTAAFVLADGSVHAAASGFADTEASLAMTPESRMLAASIGKTMVAASLMSLWDKNLVELDKPLTHRLGHLDWYSRLANHSSLTARQLLSHRSGLADHVYSEGFASELARRWREPGLLFSPEQLLTFILDQPPQASGSGEFAYSDSGFILIGLLIEAVSGQSYYDYAQSRFLGPLGLTATSPSNQRSLPGLAAGYTSADNPFGFPVKSLDQHGDLTWHPGLEWTGGGLVSNSEDLAKWGHALFMGNILSNRALEQMLDSKAIDPARPEVRYGLGVAHFQDDSHGDVFGHAGWIPAYVSSLRHYSRYGITIAFQVNTDIGLTGVESHRLGIMELALLEFALSIQ